MRGINVTLLAAALVATVVCAVGWWLFDAWTHAAHDEADYWDAELRDLITTHGRTPM